MMPIARVTSVVRGHLIVYGSLKLSRLSSCMSVLDCDSSEFEQRQEVNQVVRDCIVKAVPLQCYHLECNLLLNQ